MKIKDINCNQGIPPPSFGKSLSLTGTLCIDTQTVLVQEIQTMSIWLEVANPHVRCEIVRLILLIQRGTQCLGGTKMQGDCRWTDGQVHLAKLTYEFLMHPIHKDHIFLFDIMHLCVAPHSNNVTFVSPRCHYNGWFCQYIYKFQMHEQLGLQCFTYYE